MFLPVTPALWNGGRRARVQDPLGMEELPSWVPETLGLRGSPGYVKTGVVGAVDTGMNMSRTLASDCGKVAGFPSGPCVAIER